MDTLRLLENVIDVYLPDIKHFSSRMGSLCAGAPDYFAAASAAVAEMCRQKGLPEYNGEGIMTRGVLIRHLILPGLTGESIQILSWIKDSLPAGIPVSLMRQYVPCNNVSIPGLDRRITEREYRRVLDHMTALGLPGFLQDAESADTDFIPLFNDDSSFI